jgi:hypothetical protein
VTPTNAYAELSGHRLDAGRGYDKRSVETFRAHALDLVDELLRQVTDLEDRLVARGQPALSEAEAQLLHAFRFADSFQRRDALAVLEHASGFTPPPADDQPAAPDESIGWMGREEWLVNVGDAVTAPSSFADLDLRTPADTAEPELRLPIRVAPVAGTPRPPLPPTPWGGWVD